VKPLALLLRRLEDGEKSWVDIVRDIPNYSETYVLGAAKVYV